MNHIEKKYNEWIEKVEDTNLQNELKNMNEEAKKEAFFQDIEFGTGGLRGILGAGTNKMNIYTVSKVTQGLVQYLKGQYNGQTISVALTSDPRNMHKEFQEIIIRILGSAGIKTYVFKDIKPTPMLSNLVRNKKCQAGIMITASHNPKEYNGYKVYNHTGAQLDLIQANKMIEEVDKIKDMFKMEFLTLKNIEEKNLVEYIGDNYDEIYFEQIKNVIKDKDEKKDIKIIFTPEHGTAYNVGPKAFEYFGFTNVIKVKEQSIPDGNFSNTKSANPEESDAYELALQYAQKENADLIIANDPDADRLGIIFKNKKGEYIPYTGNQTGALLIKYLLDRDKVNEGIIYKTIVTGELGSILAQNKGVKVEETLTGFKFIGKKIEENKTDKFIFGYEESYGYLIDECVRDKDAIQASLLIAEMTNHYLNEGQYLDEIMESIYKECGYRTEITYSLSFKGLEGLEKIKKIMQYYRDNKIDKYDEYLIEKKIDYINGYEDLPPADVIKFYLTNQMGWVVFRPSGTEPKMKVYISIKGQTQEDANNKVNSIYKDILNTIEKI